MRYKVRIDLSSLERNPNHGRDSIDVHVGSHVTVSGTGQVPSEKDLEFMNGTVVHYQAKITPHGNKSEWTAQGYASGDLDESKVKALGGETVRYDHVYRSARTFDQPEYLHRNEDAEVGCSSCGAAFKHSELEADAYDNDAWSNQVCPRCGAFDCCELEYETVSEALARRDGLPKVTVLGGKP